MFLKELIANLKGNVAIGTMLFNFKKLGVVQWLLNELSPGSYLSPTGKLGWDTLKPEMFGWGKHILIAGAVSAVLKLFVGVSNLRLILLTIGITFVVEIVQFIRAKAYYINPVNSTLDIFFYVVGTLIVIKLLG
jgi:hypothetical protein